MNTIRKCKPTLTHDQAYEHFFIFMHDSMIAEALDELQHDEKVCNAISTALTSEDDCELGKVFRSAVRGYFDDQAHEYATNAVNESNYK